MSLYSAPQSISITAALATTPIIWYADSCFGFFAVQAASAVVTITWYGSHDGVSFYALYDDDNVARTTTVAASRSYRFPLEAAGCKAIKAVGNDTGVLLVVTKG